ncbi:hypothetical protein HY357_02800 [Candidatus Roizmanbacteria bacterium]|nr:hypothetical protein [Candidatus Roizmanbacteria bacterium]
MKKVRINLNNIKTKYIALVVWIIFTLFYILQSGLNNIVSSYAPTLNKIEKEIARVELENKLLENDIASASALRTIEVKAKEVGFQEPKIQYIK